MSSSDVDRRFVSLTKLLQHSFGKTLRELSLDQCHGVVIDLLPSWVVWDDLSEEQQRNAAEQWDAQHDPAFEAERQRIWSLGVQRHKLNRDLEQLDAMRATSPLERESRERQLTDLRIRLIQVEKELQGDPDERLLRRRDELKAKGVRNFNQQLAKEERISVSRVKQRIKRATDRVKQVGQKYYKS